MTDPIPARLAALKTMPMPELKAQWRELFDTEPPPFNRRLLENRHRLPHPGAGLRRAEARDDPAAGGPRRAVRQRQRHDAAASGTTPSRSPAPGWSASGRASSTPSRCWPTATSGRAGRTGRSRRSPAPSPAPAGTAWCSSASRASGARHDEADHPQAPLRGLHPQVHARKGSSRSSTRCTPSARPARPTSPASAPRAGR